MGWTENMSSREFHEEFHAFANVTQRILWQGVVAVKRARIGIADSRRLCEETRELLAARRDDRLFRRRPLNAHSNRAPPTPRRAGGRVRGRRRASPRASRRSRSSKSRRTSGHSRPSIAALNGTSTARASGLVAGSRIASRSALTAAGSAESVSSVIAAPLILVSGLARFGEELHGAAVGDFLFDPSHEGPQLAIHPVFLDAKPRRQERAEKVGA